MSAQCCSVSAMLFQVRLGHDDGERVVELAALQKLQHELRGNAARTDLEA